MDLRYAPVPKVFTVANPTAGANFTLEPDTASWWLVKSLRFLLTTSADVGFRDVSVAATDGNNEWYRTRTSANQSASQATVHCAFSGASGGASGALNSAIDWPVDGLWLPPGHTLSSVVGGIFAGDAITGIAGFAWQFPVGPSFFLLPTPPYYTKDLG